MSSTIITENSAIMSQTNRIHIGGGKRRTVLPENSRTPSNNDVNSLHNAVTKMPYWASHKNLPKARLSIAEGACIFCGSSEEDNGIVYGTMKRDFERKSNGDLVEPLTQIVAHELCMRFASNLVQSKDITEEELDNHPMDGFTTTDIKREFNRGSKLICHFCKKRGATIGCCVNNCKKGFHLPCARKNNALCEFFNEHRVWCHEHWPTCHEEMQNQVKVSKFGFYGREQCPICMDDECRVERRMKVRAVVRTNCCSKIKGKELVRYYHYDCVQNLALTWGTNSVCPSCKNKNDFQSLLEKQFVMVPQRDVALDDNGFYGFDETDDPCNLGEKCLRELAGGSRRDFEHVEDRNDIVDPWEMYICVDCGSVIHRKCAGPPWSDYELGAIEEKWYCIGCKDAPRESESAGTSAAPDVERRPDSVEAIEPVETSNEHALRMGQLETVIRNVSEYDALSVSDWVFRNVKEFHALKSEARRKQLKRRKEEDELNRVSSSNHEDHTVTEPRIKRKRHSSADKPTESLETATATVEKGSSSSSASEKTTKQPKPKSSTATPKSRPKKQVLTDQHCESHALFRKFNHTRVQTEDAGDDIFFVGTYRPSPKKPSVEKSMRTTSRNKPATITLESDTDDDEPRNEPCNPQETAETSGASTSKRLTVSTEPEQAAQAVTIEVESHDDRRSSMEFKPVTPLPSTSSSTQTHPKARKSPDQTLLSRRLKNSPPQRNNLLNYFKSARNS